jgi:cell division initiation protein
MKVTPLEIRQKNFDKKTFGGLDKDEVQAYLNSLSLAWEKVLEEQTNLRSRLENSEKEVQKLREVEATLYKTLKAAEETSQKAVDQATQQAQLIVQEARLKAETLFQEAKWKATKAMEHAEDYSRKTYDNTVGQVKVIEGELRHIENLKDAFLSEIKVIARDLLEKAEKAEQRSANIQFNFPPPLQYEMARPFLEEKEVEEVIDTLEIPQTQQTIGFAEPEVKLEEPEAEVQKAELRSANIQFNFPPPLQYEMARPFLEEKEVEEVIDTLEIPQTQQTIGFAEPEVKVEEPEAAEVQKAEPEEAPAAKELAHPAPVQAPAASETKQDNNGGGSFFDQI